MRERKQKKISLSLFSYITFIVHQFCLMMCKLEKKFTKKKTFPSKFACIKLSCINLFMWIHKVSNYFSVFIHTITRVDEEETCGRKYDNKKLRYTVKREIETMNQRWLLLMLLHHMKILLCNEQEKESLKKKEKVEHS